MSTEQALRAELQKRVDARAELRDQIEALLTRERDQSFVIAEVLKDLRDMGVTLGANAFERSPRR